MPKPIAVTVHGEQFSSMQSACEAYGISQGAIYRRMHTYGEPFEVAIERCIKKGNVHWTEKEDRILRDKYSTCGTKIPELQGRSAKAIKGRAQKLGITKPSNSADEWTTEELNILRREYHIKGCNIPELACRRSAAAIRTKARMIGLVAHRHWSEEEIETLKRKYKSCGTNIPELLGTRNRTGVCAKAVSLGLETDKRIAKSVPWTQAEIEELYDAAKNNRKPSLPGRSEAAIRTKAVSLGIMTTSVVKSVAHRADVDYAASTSAGLIAVRCKKCGAAYILPEVEALKFEHSKCSSLTPVPKGWKLPLWFRARNRGLAHSI